MEIAWIQVITIIGANLVMLFGMLGTVIALFIHSNKRLDQALKGLSDERTDFHSRLCIIEEQGKKQII